MASTKPVPRIGIGVFILRSTREAPTNPKFIIGPRLNSHGANTDALPGGHLEYGESPEECAAREVLEETGLVVKDVKYLTMTNDFMPEDGKHYVTLWMVCVRTDESEEPRNLEPEKCKGWEWVGWDEVRGWYEREKRASAGEGVEVEKKLFRPFHSLFEQRRGVLPTSV